MCDNCDSYETSEVTRGFRIVFPDGYTVYGAQFPSGRCVLDDTHSGLIEAAVSISDLPMVRKPLARIEWTGPVQFTGTDVELIGAQLAIHPVLSLLALQEDAPEAEAQIRDCAEKIASALAAAVPGSRTDTEETP